MTYVMIKMSVEDLAKWKMVFEEAGAVRKKYGSVEAHAFSKADSSNEVVVLAQFADRDKAKEMYQSQELRDIMQRAGVKGPPEITYLDEVVKLAA